MRVAGHRRISPGAGSSTASSRLSVRVTDSAPLMNVASSTTSGASPMRSRVSSRNGMACSTHPEAPLQVMDVLAAGTKGLVTENLLVQGDVGLDAFDDHFAQRVLHAGNGRLARL